MYKKAKPTRSKYQAGGAKKVAKSVAKKTKPSLAKDVTKHIADKEKALSKRKPQSKAVKAFFFGDVKKAGGSKKKC
jgi:hypothetical protein